MHLLPFSLVSLLYALLPSAHAGEPQCVLKVPQAGGNYKPIPGPTKPNPPPDPSNPVDKCIQNKVASTWYVGWHGSQFPPSSVSWGKYTSVIYAFATPTPDTSVINLSDYDRQLIPKFVSTAHENGVRAGLSIGGWGGSEYYSSCVGSAENRTIFAQAILDIAAEFNLDQIDFDWEYPNREGAGNIVSPEDSLNFLAFLQQFRSTKAGRRLTLSAAVSVTPFAGPDGSPLKDVSDFANVLDYIEVMNYDIYGSWEATAGPNAPLNDTCAPVQAGSAVSALAAWTAASFPADQIVLGIASYGHAFNVTPTAASGANNMTIDIKNAPCPKFAETESGDGDGWDGNDGYDMCGNPLPAGGVYDFWGLISGGYLRENGSVQAGIEYRFDTCSQTPFVYSPASQLMLSFDDARSFTAKGQFINNEGLLGFAMWEAGGDYNDILLDAMNIATVCPSS